MGKSTKFAALFTAMAMVTAMLSAVNMPSTAVYAASAADGYFYSQLSKDAQIFYKAMEQMDNGGVFRSGASFDLVAEGLLTSQQAEGYGPGALLSLYGAARDAFYADHADIFYVDFSYLTLRVTVDSSGKTHVYLGAGRSDSYYTKGFTDKAQIDAAITEYEAAINNIVSGAQGVAAEDGSSRSAEMVKYVHDYIVDHTSYRLEDRCSQGNAGFVRTAYGSVVKGEAVCEGYSRAFKAVMDRLGIPCVLVYGVYMYDKNTPEEHMWCQVQLDGTWYAVDATMDDPATKNSSRHGIDGYENQDYLLVGSSCMDRQHYANGIMSSAEYEFAYPKLSVDGYNVEVIGSYGGLTVKFKSDGEHEDTEAGIFYVSYNGMGVARMAEHQGRYLLAKMSVHYEATDEWIIGDWGYILPELYRDIEDFDTEVRLPAPHISYAEFAVTDIPPEEYDGTNLDFSVFKGDTTAFPAYSGIIYNPSGGYIKPPYLKSITPGVTSLIDVEKTHHVVAVYDDVLQLTSEDAVPGIAITAENAVQNGAPCSAERYARVENVRWDGVSTVEFDFTPSKMWLDDSVIYTLNITGLTGARSGKAPNPVSYCTRFSMCPCAYRAYGYDWALFAKPTLMDSFDLDVSTWETADGERISQELASRMVLVVSDPSASQTKEMLDMIDENVLDYQTFNINLTVCKAQVVRTGQKVRVHLGFPEGYGPNDAGVTFKAYHFSKDGQGNITDVNEIECIVTQYGLVILCDSFSPYAIVAVPADESANAARTAVLCVGEGGAVTGADSILTLAENETKTFTVAAKDGYVIDSISCSGKSVDIGDRKTVEVTVGYGDIAGGIIDIRFLAETVYREEAAMGETTAAGAVLNEGGTPQSSQEDVTVQPVVDEGSDAEVIDNTEADSDADQAINESRDAVVDEDITDGGYIVEDEINRDSLDKHEIGGEVHADNENGADGEGQIADNDPKSGSTLVLILLMVIFAAGACITVFIKKKHS